jgi:hypothetical protein
MKHYLLEPTYKKSVVEFTLFKRKNEEGKDIFLRKELGWRWGSFMISVPETPEEELEFAESLGYDSVETLLEDHYGYGPEDEMSLQDILLPDESDDFVDITEDYGHAEMIECWDGCWEFWSVDSYHVELDEDEQEAIIEEVEEAYGEEYEEGVEALGWEFVDTYFEMHCSPKLTPCDENGQVAENADN